MAPEKMATKKESGGFFGSGVKVVSNFFNNMVKYSRDYTIMFKDVDKYFLELKAGTKFTLEFEVY